MQIIKMINEISIFDKKVKLTVYIPCFGYHQFIKKAIESLKLQSFKEFICKIYILENDEEGFQIVNEEISEDQRFIIEKLSNQPTMQSLGNFVLSNATSEYILRLDADDKLDEFGLQILINAADKDKMIAMVWGCFYYCSEDGELYNISPYRTLLSNRIDPPHGACSLFRTSALRAISGYDEKIKSQDGFDVWQRLKSIYKVKSLPQVIFYYTQHSNSLSKSKKRMTLSSEMIYKRKEKAFSGSLKKSFLIVAGIKEFYNRELEQNYIIELEEKENGGNTIIDLIDLTKSIETETNLIISTTSNRVLNYCKKLGDNKKSFIASYRKDKSLNNVPLINILRHGLNEYMKFSENLPSMLIFVNTHTKLPTKEEINDSWLKLTCSSNSIFMPTEIIREIVLHKMTEKLEIINPGRFEDIYPAHEKLWKWKENFLCCTPDSILQDYLFKSISSDF